MYDGIRAFAGDLKQKGDLLVINQYVNPALEMAEITDRISKQPGGGKAILFNNTGSKLPVLMNMMGSAHRMAMVTRCETLNGLTEKIERFLQSLLPGRRHNKLSLLHTLWQLCRLMPAERGGRGKCQEIVNTKPDLHLLPVLQCWPGDGGRFITLPVVHTRHPVTGQRNAGMYRMHCYDACTTGMHWHPYKGGAQHFEEWKKQKQPMPVAVTLGGDPLYTYCATAPLPDNIDEYMLAGILRNHRVNLVRCITQNIYVPEDADIVIEGYIDPDEPFRTEGPFGDHTGFYSPAGLFPVFHVTAITMRRDAVYPATLVGIPPQEDAWIAKATERLFLPILRNTMLPEVLDLNIPVAGTGHNLTIVQIESRFMAQAQKVMHFLWGSGQMIFNKILILTSPDTPADDYLSIARNISAGINLIKNVYFSRGPLDILDHASYEYGKGGKLCIDATHPVLSDNNQDECNYLFEMINAAMPELTARNNILNIYPDLLLQGIRMVFITIQRTHPNQVRKTAETLISETSFNGVTILIFTDYAVTNLHLACWLIAANIDPGRDVFPAGSENRPCLVFDGTAKNKPFDNTHHPWPEILTMNNSTIEHINRIWETLNTGNTLSSPTLLIKTLQQ